MDISLLFNTGAVQFGWRGDPCLWEALHQWFSKKEIPTSSDEFKRLLEIGFEEITGELLSTEERVYVKELDVGGMSGGCIHVKFWRDIGIPLLIQRHLKLSKTR